MTNNSINSSFTNNADGFTIGGGTTSRTLTTISGNITLSGGGSNTYTFPASTDTLVGRASTDTLSNKTLDSSNIIDATNWGNNVIPANALSTTAISLGNPAIITTDFSTSSTSYVYATGLTKTVTFPSGGRQVEVSAWAGSVYNGTGGNGIGLAIFTGASAGTLTTQLTASEHISASTNYTGTVHASYIYTPSAGSVTFSVGVKAITGGTAHTNSQSTIPTYLLVKVI